MAQVFPFRAYRFNPELAPFDRVLTQPYDKISPERQAEYYAMHPQNLIAVEKGRVFPDDSPQNNVYSRATAKVDEWIRDRVVLQDPVPAFYAYAQEFTVPGSDEKRTLSGPDGSTPSAVAAAAPATVLSRLCGSVNGTSIEMRSPRASISAVPFSNETS